jgi:hypothetical protein
MSNRIPSMETFAKVTWSSFQFDDFDPSPSFGTTRRSILLCGALFYLF